MSSAPPLPLLDRLDGFPMECAGGHPFLSGFVVTPGLCAMGGSHAPHVSPVLSLMGETN